MEALKQLVDSPYEKKRAFEEIANKIKELIAQGELKPGDRLPPEAEIARQFNVGRNTIREALRVLELSGFVKVKRGGKGGPLIADTSLNRISNLLVDLVRFQDISKDELKLARCETEKMILHEVVKNIDDQDISDLRENIAKAEQKLAKGNVAYDDNINFHRLLAKASKNYIYIIQAELVLTLYSDFRTIPANLSLNRSKTAIKHHKKILDAIIAGKNEVALSLLEKELLMVGDWLGGDE